MIRATWQGGVTLPCGAEVDDGVRLAYRVTVEDADGGTRDVAPFALGDLGDGDNNHLLCFFEKVKPRAVHFPAGRVIDPNGDLNPATSIEVTPVRQVLSEDASPTR